MNTTQMSFTPETLKPIELRCPTCRVRISSQNQCRRCGAELSLLIKTASHAYQLREKARRCLLEGKFKEAYSLAQQAQFLHKTEQGYMLQSIANIIVTR